MSSLGTYEITMHMILRDRKGNELTRKKIVSESPDDWFFEEYFGSIIWKTDTEVWLMQKEGEKAASKIDFA